MPHELKKIFNMLHGKSFGFLIFVKLAEFVSGILFSLLRFPSVIQFARLVNRLVKPSNDVSVNVHGHKMYANTLDRIIAMFLWKFSALESYETKLVGNIVKEGMVVVDVGANIGYYTLQMARLVGQKGKVYAIEPDPSNYKLLVKNIRANIYQNVVAIERAVSNSKGSTRLFICEEHKGDHRIFDLQGERKSIEVETMKLDDLLLTEDRIDVIKMDIQGAEYVALLGMENLIRKNKGLIFICEFAPFLLRDCGFSAKQVLDKIREYGFRIQFIDEKQKCIKEISADNLIAMCGDSKYVNLYLEKHSD